MAKLIWYDTEGNPVEYELKQGVNRIGRDLSNDLALDHESISGVHCEILNYPDETVLRDLDSTNGLQVNSFPVTEVELQPGQIISVGDVELTFQSGESAKPNIKIVSESVSISAGEVHCERCQKTVTISESKERRVGKVMLYFCPTCGSRCETFSPPSEQIKAAPVAEKTFSQYLLDAFVYPFRENGLIILISGTAFFVLMNWFISCLSIIGFAYFFNYMKEVANASAQGGNEAPSWPEFSDFFSDIIRPCLQFLAMFLLCSAPGYAWLTYGPEAGRVPVAVSFIMLGAFYFPMSFVGVALFDTLSVMNPVFILNSIMRILSHYLIVFFFLLGLLAIKYAGYAVGGWIQGQSDDLATVVLMAVAVGLVTEFIALYLSIVMSRILGVMYYVNRKKLGWF